MSSSANLLFIAPLALGLAAVAGAVDRGRRPRGTLLAARIATLLALGLSTGALAALAIRGPVTGATLGFDGIGFAVRLDALSAVMFALVAFVGVVVVQFSRNYMDGDARQGAFVGGLCLVLCTVVLLVLAGNLLQLVLAWIGTSLSLHRLLVFYPDRPGARIAARKKFITARLGDLFLIAAVALLVARFGTFDLATLLDRAGQASFRGQMSDAASIAAMLIALTALLKSAQFPTHGWLLDVMETPTPVSALLHAGIVNAGGFLLVRFSDVLLLNGAAMNLVAVVGGLTALTGALVMLTQPAVKTSLAWSTVAQMGFMMLQCGVGAFSIAVLHIVAHSLYKAHAFLSSGSVVDVARGGYRSAHSEGASPVRVAASLLIALAAVFGAGVLCGMTPSEDPTIFAFGAIFVLGTSQFVFAGLPGAGADAGGLRIVVRTVATAVLLSVGYFALQLGTAALLARTVPGPASPHGFTFAVLACVAAAFAATTACQLGAVGVPAELGRRVYVHIANGFYANALFTRLAGGLRRSVPTSAIRETSL